MGRGYKTVTFELRANNGLRCDSVLLFLLHQWESHPVVDILPFASCSSEKYLLVILLLSVLHDVEEAELVHALGGRDNAEPVTELLLLEVLLCTIANQYQYSEKASNFEHGKRTGTSSNGRRTPGVR